MNSRECMHVCADVTVAAFVCVCVSACALPITELQLLYPQLGVERMRS